MGDWMKDRKYTKEDKRYMESMWIDFGVILVFAIPCCSNIPGLENFGFITGIIPIVLFFGVIFLIRKYVRAHNQKIDKELLFEKEKKEAELKAEADKEKIKSQIWVNE